MNAQTSKFKAQSSNLVFGVWCLIFAGCGITGYSWWIRLVKALGFQTFSTIGSNYLTSQVLFMPKLLARITRAKDGFSQPNYRANYLLAAFFSPLSTLPITKTIK